MLDDAFGYWFAGFTDGEGCFTFDTHRSNYGLVYYLPRFAIHLRVDDLPLLNTIAERIGVGKVYYNNSEYLRKAGIKASDGAIYMVRRKDCQVIVNLFRAYPLLGLKRHDFELWAKAVDVQCSSRNQIVLKQYKDALQELRANRKEAICNQGSNNHLENLGDSSEPSKPLLPIPETIRMI